MLNVDVTDQTVDMLLRSFRRTNRCLPAFYLLPSLILLFSTLLWATYADGVDWTDLPASDSKDNTCPAAWWLRFAPPPNSCPPAVLKLRNVIYVLYDVNHGEGFNLRRDVYVRLAVFIRHLRKRKYFENVRLVLPPWPKLYHWNSHNLQQANQAWADFFDITSLRRFAPVLDFNEFLAEYSCLGQPGAPYINIEQVYRLQNFDDILHGKNSDDEKFEMVRGRCSEASNNGGQLLNQPMLHYTRYACVYFQGGASWLQHLLRQALRELQKRAGSTYEPDDPKAFVILSAEVPLHDDWGSEDFWRGRRSMRFAPRLVAVAKDFRRMQLNTDDIDTRTQRPPMWEMERQYRGARGGNYLCAHLRRGDFMHGHPSTTPTLQSAAKQIKYRMRELNITTVFVATDATPHEINLLYNHFAHFHLVHFVPKTQEERFQLKDGGIAIIDQLICAYARHFMGTYESTFTYRIYEEREILGFTQRKTFNTLCKYESLVDCQRNTVWPIRY